MENADVGAEAAESSSNGRVRHPQLRGPAGAEVPCLAGVFAVWGASKARLLTGITGWGVFFSSVATAAVGYLSAHLAKLEAGRVVAIDKRFEGRIPGTQVAQTERGRDTSAQLPGAQP